jgi:hypothetical protein
VVKRTSFPIADGAYADQTRPYSFQECVNWIPEPSETEGSKTPAILRGAPGLAPVGSFTNEGIRGLHDVEGVLFVVSGIALIERNNGVNTIRGSIPGTGPVEFAHNQVAGGNQLVISIASSACWVFDTTDNSLTQITDPGFPGGHSPVFVDGYIAFISPEGDFWFHSELNDALSYNTLDRYQGEFSPDKLVALRTIQGRIRAFSARTIEEYSNSGALTNTFVRGAVVEEGCIGRYTPEVLDNSLIWLGADGIIYRDFAYSPQRISTYAIEQALSTVKSEWSSARAMTYSDRGHKIYYLNVGGFTFGYDCATGKWHTRESYGQAGWRISSLAFSDGAWYAGEENVGNIYEVDWETYTEYQEPLVCRRTTGVMYDSQNRVICSAFELLFNPGFGAENAKVMLRYSDDGGHSFSDMREESMGLIGQYQRRAQFLRLGSFRERIWDIRISAPVNRDVLGAVIVAKGTDG